MMKPSGNNRLRLKIKKKDTNATIKYNLSSQRKRSNPFTEESVKKVHQSIENTCIEGSSVLLSKLDSIQPSDWSIDKTVNIVKSKDGIVREVNDDPVEDEEDPEETHEWKYSSSLFPLDWSIKQKIQLISKEPLSFCSNIKSIDKAIGIKRFASNDHEHPEFYQYLCNWIYPFLPGIRNFPLKKNISENMVSGMKENRTAGAINNINISFQEAILQQWKCSFQSLFNMVKSNICPYFYVCGHQFSVLFKGSEVVGNNTKVLLTPTTKGLRAMLTEEDIAFVFTYQDDVSNSTTTTTTTPTKPTTPATKKTKKDDEKNKSLSEDSEYDADTFLNSIGLDKETHFPNIEEQRKLSVKFDLKRLDNRPESTIEINDSQAFFNFLINSPLLCATSGSMIGIPPTLLSPVVFEGATCQVNKYNNGKIKQKTKLSDTFLYCLDIYGFILPTNLKSIVDLQLKQSCNEFKIRTKGYENLFAFNNTMETPCDDLGNKTEFLNQSSHSIPDQGEVQYSDELFKF